MKRFIQKTFCALAGAAALVFACGTVSYAAEYTAPSEELRQQADSLDISNDVFNNADTINELHQAGVRVFDTADLLSDEDKDKLEMLLDGVADKAGYDVAVFTANDINGHDHTEDFADEIFFDADLGTGDDRDGTILVMETGGPSAYIYTHGIAIRYLTDSGIDYIYDELDGGLWPKFESGDYAGACAVYADGILEAAEEGISQDQYNENTETGEIDYYYDQQKHISVFQILIAAVISCIAGILPVRSIKSSYAMKNANAKAAEGAINQAYRAESAYKMVSAAGGTLINRFETTERIPRQTRSSGSGGGHFSGGSSVHSGMGGSVHGGGGRGAR